METGDPAYALALTEPGAGSDNNSATTSYTRKTARCISTGRKRLSLARKSIHICWYWLAIRSQKIRRKPLRCGGWIRKTGIKVNPLHKIGWHMFSTCEVILMTLKWTKAIWSAKKAWVSSTSMYNFEMERLINAARSTGFAECAFEDAARYANQRIAFGKPIGHNQMIRENWR